MCVFLPIRRFAGKKKGDSSEFMEGVENSIVARAAIWSVLDSSAVSKV